MKKKLLKIGGAIVATALVIYLACALFLGSMVTSAVKRFGSQLTQTKVDLTYAQISPLSGVGTLRGLTVANTPGWSADNAFSLGKIHVEVVPSSIFGDTIVVKDLTIEDPKFDYETKFVSSNVGELLKNVQSATGSGRAAKATTSSGKPVKYQIKRLRVLGGTVTVGVGPAAMTLAMPPIDLADLGSTGGGVTSDQLALIVMRTLTTSVVETTTKSLLKDPGILGAAAGDSVKKAATALQGLLGGNPK